MRSSNRKLGMGRRMSLPRLIASMQAAGCSAEQIGQAAISFSAGERSGNAERQARFRARKKTAEQPEGDGGLVTVTVTDNVTDNVISNASNVTDNVTSNAESNVDAAHPRVGAFFIGEEVSILPLEKATLSIPKGTENEKPATRKPKPKVSRLGEDFSPSPSMRDYARRHGLSNAQIDADGEAIRDWSLSSPAGAKLDWEATWRGWVRRSAERGRPPPRAGPNGHSPLRVAPFTPRTQALMDIFNEPTDARDD